ncbi:MAG TPA: GNAT family N-acetyltransferase [Casimicrobiaceae bacterium]
MRQDFVARSQQRSAPQAVIHQADSPEDIEQARALFLEYAQWLGVDLCFQDFSRELAELPGAYAPPSGRILLAAVNTSAFGCVALRALDDRVGEVKRMYVQPARRGEGWGRQLAVAIVAQARFIGYRELVLDTLSRLTSARALYAELGFSECAPYYANPLPDVVYMRLRLDANAPV